MQKWHDNQLIDAPKEGELNLLLKLAYKAIESLKTPNNLLSISQLVNELNNFASGKPKKEYKEATPRSPRRRQRTVEHPKTAPPAVVQ